MYQTTRRYTSSLLANPLIVWLWYGAVVTYWYNLSTHTLQPFLLKIKHNIYKRGGGATLTRTSMSMCHSAATSARMIWSESMKMTLRSDSGNSTSRNRILYAQMMRCFSVCATDLEFFFRAKYWPLLTALYTQRHKQRIRQAGMNQKVRTVRPRDAQAKRGNSYAASMKRQP